jgi:hypothetical protein
MLAEVPYPDLPPCKCDNVVTLGARQQALAGEQGGVEGLLAAPRRGLDLPPLTAASAAARS